MDKSKTPTPADIVLQFLQDNKFELQVSLERQKIRYMDDGGIVIDPPKYVIGVVEKKPTPAKNGKNKIDVN